MFTLICLAAVGVVSFGCFVVLASACVVSGQRS